MKEIHLYTDGSHFKGSGHGRLGIGGVLIDPEGPGKGKVLDELSLELSQTEITRNYGGNGKTSNPTLEMIAVLVCIREFKSSLKRKKVTVFADYLGVREWLTGAWKTKEPWIGKLRDLILTETRGLDIEYSWVRGHQNPRTSTEAYWNNRADWLAKGGN